MSLEHFRATSPRAIVIGASGGIGGALAAALYERGFAVTGLSRRSDPPLALRDEATIAAAARHCAEQAPFSVIIVATGLLHADGVAPEKSWRDLDADALARLFAINTIGPALAAKHFLPLLPREGRCAFAALSARIGSIGDNRLGGWYGYRASKAALNMMVRTLAIELARTHCEALCVGLHPGTVDTPLSKPFQRNVPPAKLFTREKSAECLLDVLDTLEPAGTGRCFAWDGAEIVP